MPHKARDSTSKKSANSPTPSLPEIRPLFSVSQDLVPLYYKLNDPDYSQDFYLKAQATYSKRIDKNVYTNGLIRFGRFPGVLPNVAHKLFWKPVILIDNFEIQDGGRNHNVLTQHIGEMFVDRVLPFINFYYDKAFTTSIIGIREVIDDTEWQDTITNSNVVFSLIIVYYPNSKLHKLYAVALKTVYSYVNQFIDFNTISTFQTFR